MVLCEKGTQKRAAGAKKIRVLPKFSCFDPVYSPLVRNIWRTRGGGINSSISVDEKGHVRTECEGGNLRKSLWGGMEKCLLYKGIPTESIFKNDDAPTSR